MLAGDIVRRTELLNTIINHFWKRWKGEYLLELRQNHQMLSKKKELVIATGDVVLIHEDGKKRNRWPLGKIEELMYGKDGIIRGAKVKTSQGYLQRPFQKLYLLEVRSDHIRDCSEEISEKNEPVQLETKLNQKEDEADKRQTVSSSGVPKGSSPGGRANKYNELTSMENKMKSKRIAAIDGQLRRRMKDVFG